MNHGQDAGDSEAGAPGTSATNYRRLVTYKHTSHHLPARANRKPDRRRQDNFSLFSRLYCKLQCSPQRVPSAERKRENFVSGPEWPQYLIRGTAICSPVCLVPRPTSLIILTVPFLFQKRRGPASSSEPEPSSLSPLGCYSTQRIPGKPPERLDAEIGRISPARLVPRK